jgi:pimeloyl-ACP methyl ester carboxylesterase
MKTFLFLFILAFLLECKSEPGNFIKTSDGIDMYYESHGSGEPTLVFIPSFTCDASTWNDQISYFKEKFHIVAADLPGFGRSGSNRNNWSIDRYGEDVAELAYELNLDNMILIGHSLGAGVALQTTKNLKGRVNAVIMVDQFRTLDLEFDSTYSTNLYNTYRDNYKNFDFMYKYFGNDSALAKRLIDMGKPSYPEFWYTIWMEYARWCDSDVIPTVSEIHIPIKAINSDRSETKLDEWNTYARDFKAIIFENCGHYVHWEYPDKFNRSLHDLIQEVIE